MKSSIKFREEKSPLLRAKLPFKLGPIPFSSGIAVGNKQDLAVHLGTGFSAGPIIKVALKPHDPNPLSVILKAGLGLWGSPKDVPFTLTAELCLTPNGGDRLVSLRLKPRIGDFSIRRDVKNVNFLFAPRKEVTTTSVRLLLHENGEQSHVMVPRKGENGSMLSSCMNADVKAAPNKHIDGNCLDKQQLHSPSVDSNSPVIGSNISLKVEGLEKGRNDRKPNLEGLNEQDVKADMSSNNNAMIVHVPCGLHERMNRCKSSASFSLAGAQDALRGCKVVIHSSLPLGSQSRLNIRWGVKSAPEFFQGWDGSLPSLSLSKLPSLLLDKVSFEQVTARIEKPSTNAGGPETIGSFEQGLLPVNFVEENRELAQVAKMCYTMKRQLHLIHAENQVLRRAMEDMKSHVESKGSWIYNGIADGILTNGQQSLPRPPHKSSLFDAPIPPQQRREGGHCDIQVQKGQKVMPRNDEDLHLKSISPEGNNVNVSKELEKAILNAQIGSAAGKKE